MTAIDVVTLLALGGGSLAATQALMAYYRPTAGGTDEREGRLVAAQTAMREAADPEPTWTPYPHQTPKNGPRRAEQGREECAPIARKAE